MKASRFGGDTEYWIGQLIKYGYGFRPSPEPAWRVTRVLKSGVFKVTRVFKTNMYALTGSIHIDTTVILPSWWGYDVCTKA